MSISRRDLLKRGSVLSAAAAITAIVPRKLRAAALSNGEIYSEVTFSRLKGTHFKLTGGELEAPVYLTLVGVEAIRSGGHSARECNGFILSFLGGPAEELKQDLYTFSSLANPALGSFQMLTVPAKNRLYQVVVFQLAGK